MTLSIGFHILRSGKFDIYKLIKDTHTNYNINTIQIFSQGKLSKYAPTTNKYTSVQKAKQYIEKNNIKVFIHASYITSLTKSTFKSNIESLLFDFQICRSIGGIGVVIHPGSNVEDNDKIYSMISKNIHSLITILKKFEVKSKIILEIEAKCGRKVITDLSAIMKLWNTMKKRYSKSDLQYVQFCLDTCHMFVSKVPMKTKQDIRNIFSTIDPKLIALIHLNDSLSYTQDRHADLFIGLIGNKKYGGNPDVLIEVAKIAEKNNIPMIIERSKQSEDINYLQVSTIKNILRYYDKDGILHNYYKIYSEAD
jgi:endonuclease IV